MGIVPHKRRQDENGLNWRRLVGRKEQTRYAAGYESAPPGGNPVAILTKKDRSIVMAPAMHARFGSKIKGVAEGMGFEPTIRG